MKKLTLFAVLLMAGLLIVTGCKKAEKTPEGGKTDEPAATKSTKGGVTPEAISGSLSTELCKRMVEIGKGSIKEDECVTQTKTSLLEALKVKPLSITQAQLNTCLKSIKEGSAEIVTGTEPPPGCEFLQ